MRVTDEMVEAAVKQYILHGHYGTTKLGEVMRDVLAAALSHAAGQDGEQCRAASVEPDAWLYEYEHDGESDHCLSRVRFIPSWVEAKRATEHPLYLRALSRGAPEGMVLVPVEPTKEMETAHRMYGDTSDWWQAVTSAAISAQRKEGE
jgi:hypothetical protein